MSDTPARGGTAAPPADEEVRIGGFVEALKVQKSLELATSQPPGKGDPVLTARLKEVRGYIDVFLKAEAPRRPRFTVVETKADPAAPVPVEADFRDVIQFYESLSLSLSRGGVFIKCEPMLAIDALLDLKVKLEQEDVSFRVTAKVIWINPRDAQGRPQGMGLKLPKMSAVQRQILSDFMDGDASVETLAHLTEV